MNDHQPRQRAAILPKFSAETTIWPLALKTFALLTAIIITLMLLLGWTEYRADYNALTIESKANLDHRAATVQRIFQTVIGDLYYLSEQVHLDEYLEWSGRRIENVGTGIPGAVGISPNLRSNPLY